MDEDEVLNDKTQPGSGLRFLRFFGIRTSTGRLGEAGEVEAVMKNLSALSIRQPYAEQVLLGTKDVEYRAMPTHKRERVYIYASKTPAADEDAWAEIGKQPGELRTGVIVGTVEVVGCRKVRGEYYWDLAKPIRLKRPIKPKKHPQPAWFNPF